MGLVPPSDTNLMIMGKMIMGKGGASVVLGFDQPAAVLHDRQPSGPVAGDQLESGPPAGEPGPPPAFGNGPGPGPGGDLEPRPAADGHPGRGRGDLGAPGDGDRDPGSVGDLRGQRVLADRGRSRRGNPPWPRPVRG